MSILTVGTGQQFKTIAAAVAASQDGDTIDVQAGIYKNDFFQVNDSITLQAIGGMVTIAATVAPSNLKGIITVGDGSHAPDVTVSGFELAGAAIPAADGNNGAGIRYQAGNLTLNDDDLQNNQDGLLATPAVAGTGTITVNQSEFIDNGAGDGQTHNIYVGKIDQFTFDDSYSTAAIVGHDIKSRALNTIIENSRITDGPSGTASYEIDLPNGGNAVIQGNTIEQGPLTKNPVIISYGEEGSITPGSSLTVSGNTILNDLHTSPSVVAVRNSTAVLATISDNQVFGLTGAQLTSGPATVSDTTWLAAEPALNVTPPWELPPSDGDPGTIYLAAYSHSVVGGTGSLTVYASGNYDTVIGGAGGMAVYATGGEDLVETQAGTANTISLSNTGTVVSAGTDAIRTRNPQRHRDLDRHGDDHWRRRNGLEPVHAGRQRHTDQHRRRSRAGAGRDCERRRFWFQHHARGERRGSPVRRDRRRGGSDGEHSRRRGHDHRRLRPRQPDRDDRKGGKHVRDAWARQCRRNQRRRRHDLRRKRGGEHHSRSERRHLRRRGFDARQHERRCLDHHLRVGVEHDHGRGGHRTAQAHFGPGWRFAAD